MEIARLNRASSSSSHASIATPVPYDVFVSFYGEDTRKRFTSHLLAALEQSGFHAFRDDEKLKRGEHIGDELEKAIEESRISLVVLSQNYAKSRWCLNELVKIMDCKEKLGQIVFPIFHGVEPSDVRAQKGYFAEAFAKHAKHARVENWREALTNVANLSGWDLENVANGDEACLVEQVVKEVQNKLDIVLHVASNDIGLESRLEKLEEKLKMEADDVRIVAICGMGGIGKTTIAKKLYNVIQHKFEGSGFVANIRETSKQPNGKVSLQEQLLSDILKSETHGHGIRNFHQGIEVIKRRAFCRKVLLILDDVDNVQQLKDLAINRDSFHIGSRIVITTRVRDLPDVDEVYEAEELDTDESLKLFSGQCFEKDRPTDDYLELSNQVVHYTGGLPLAIEVLAPLFRGKSMGECESQLAQLREVPHDDVQTKLKISYDSLSDRVKDLFLDVACFFVGTDGDFTVKMLEGCKKIAVVIAIRCLVDRCLIKFDKGKIVMHDLLRDMGREIVRGQGQGQGWKNPGKWSRLWNHMDALEVLENAKGTEAIEGLVLNFHELNEVYAKPKAFQNMFGLWLLHLNYVHLREGYEHISKSLKWLCWNGFPLRCLPPNLHMENLVTLDLRYSSLKEAWKGTKKMVNLKFLYLSHCYQLVETPNFSGLDNLKELLLNDCKSLVKVDGSILCLKKLVILDMKNCAELRWFSYDILMLKSLENVDLSGCSTLGNFPRFEGSQLKSLVLSFVSSRILRTKGAESIHSSPSHVLGCLKKLSMRDCSLSCLPNEVRNLISLETLDISGNNIGTLPDGFWGLTRLQALTMERCNLSCLPNEVGTLTSLKTLDLSRNNLCAFPDGLCNLIGLVCLNLSRCNLLHLPSQIGRLTSLGILDLGKNDLCTLPDSICDLPLLMSLELNSCKLSHLPDRIGNLDTLFSLDISGNSDLLSLPHSFRDLPSLSRLSVESCRSLQSLPQLPEIFYSLCASGCTSLESIGTTKFNWRQIYLDGCNTLAKNNSANDLLERIGFQVSPPCLPGREYVILLPGNEVPNWFHRFTGSRYFKVPRRIRGWILCIVWTVVQIDEWSPLLILCLRLGNRWYGANIVPSSLSQGDQLYINCTRSDGDHFGPFLRGLCPGDELEISIMSGDDTRLTVNECGVNFFYEDDEDGDADHEKNSYRENDDEDGDPDNF